MIWRESGEMESRSAQRSCSNYCKTVLNHGGAKYGTDIFVGLRSFVLKKNIMGGESHAENHIGLCKQDAEKP